MATLTRHSLINLYGIDPSATENEANVIIFKDLLTRNTATIDSIKRIYDLLTNKTELLNTISDDKTLFMKLCLLGKNDFIDIVLNDIKSGDIIIDMDIVDNKNNSLDKYVIITKHLKLINEMISLGLKVSPNLLIHISKTDKPFYDKLMADLYDKKVFDYEQVEDVPFKIFNESEIIFGKELASGSFGKVYKGRDASTNQEYAIKEFKVQAGTINDDILKDILFLRSLNKTNCACKIYGILRKADGKFYMILELLSHEISDEVEKIINIENRELRIKYATQLMKECLICVDKMSTVGLIHCDTKDNNMMINSKGQVKYIDFGYSYFLGIAPKCSDVNHTIHSGIYVLDDGTNENVSHTYNLNGVDTTIKKGFIGYNYDIPSIAKILFESLYGYTDYICSHDGTFYYVLKCTRVNKEWRNRKYVMSDEHSLRILDVYGRELRDLLLEMLEIDPSLRPTAKELLNRPLFNRGILVIPQLEITNLTSNLNSFSSITQHNNHRMGFAYFDQIREHYKNSYISYSRYSQDYFKTKILKICTNLETIYKVNKGSIFAGLNFTNKLFNNNQTLSENDILTCLIISISFYNMIYSSDHQEHYYDLSSRLLIFKNNGVDYNVSYDKMLEMILTSQDFYDFKPIFVFIGYIRYLLQAVSTDRVKIEQNIEYIENGIIPSLLYRDFDNKQYMDYILEIHNTNSNKINI